MMTDFVLSHKREDGTFVIVLQGHPYHVTEDDLLFPEVAEAAAELDEELPVEVPPPPPPPGPVVLTPLAFFDLFTADEEAGIAQAAQTNPQVLLWLAKASGAQEILLDDYRTQAGIGFLVYLGLLTSDRAREILG